MTTVFTNPATGAADAAAAYIRAVLDTLGTRDPLAVLGGTPAGLRSAVSEVHAEALRVPEARGRWSVGEVFAHLADSELVWAFRLRMILGQDRPTLGGYDQDAWARRMQYAKLPPAESLDRFDRARTWNLQLLRRLPDEDLDRVGVHAERGEESVRHMVRLYAGHDLVHAAQVERILATVAQATPADG